jgi:hypothetical protein
MNDTGHGHVTPRLDGSLARCGGPGLCSACSIAQEQERRREAATKYSGLALDEMRELRSRFGYGSGGAAGPPPNIYERLLENLGEMNQNIREMRELLDRKLK